MLFIFCYIFIYCSIDELLNKFYLSNFDLSSFNTYNIIIQDNQEFYYSLKTINQFILSVYGFYIFYFLFIGKIKNMYALALSFIYFKYTLNIFINDNITIYNYEYSRAVMWVFATPLMLKLYCDINNLQLQDIRFLYHYIPCIFNIIIYPLKNNIIIYSIYTILSFISIFLFMKRLLSFHNEKFTKIFCSIWSMFIILHIVDILQIVNVYTLNIMYLTSDMIGKISTNFFINDNNLQEYYILNNIDLQCINFITYILNKIKKYETNNVKQSKECLNLLKYTKNKLNKYIPQNKADLQIELLKKILPFDFEQKYIINSNLNLNSNINMNKPFTNICVLFTDIVSYSELANKYDDNIIFNLLNNIYIKFDILIKKYSHLQKIETIGDAYMVTGDIFRNNEDDYSLAVKEIILLALDFIKEIKTI